MIALYIIAGIVGFLVLFFLFGLWHLRRSIHQAATELKRVKVEDIAFLSEECVRVFSEKLGQELRLDDLESAAWILDNSLAGERTKKAFQRADFYWYFVKPVGAFAGELLRHHAGGEWQQEAGRPPYLTRTTVDQATVTTSPFEKVLRHVAANGKKGDFYAYLKAGAAMGPPSDAAQHSAGA